MTCIGLTHIQLLPYSIFSTYLTPFRKTVRAAPRDNPLSAAVLACNVHIAV
jgi:hypothetical protein